MEGKTIVFEYRYADGKFERLPDLATELVGLKVNVIVTGGPTATRPAKKATATIPIVMAQDTDPVGNGFVASLARPGGNITGLSNYHADLSGKQLELLKEVVPEARSRAYTSETSNEPGQSRKALKETVTRCQLRSKVRIQYPRRAGDLQDIENAFRCRAQPSEPTQISRLAGPVCQRLSRQSLHSYAAKSRVCRQ